MGEWLNTFPVYILINQNQLQIYISLIPMIYEIFKTKVKMFE
jgi:hypothetical protein